MNTTMNAIWTSGTAPQYGQTVRQFFSKMSGLKCPMPGFVEQMFYVEKGL